jgi:hypothetical protein
MNFQCTAQGRTALGQPDTRYQISNGVPVSPIIRELSNDGL